MKKSFKKMDKRAWLKIVEAFVAIIFIAMILLVLVNKGSFKRNDDAERIYEIELSILREIQTNTELRADVLAVNSTPMGWDDPYFPLNIKNKILSRLPNYLNCEAKICALNETCSLVKAIEKDIYAQAIAITVNVGSEEFKPRQLRLFCWTGLAPEPEYPEGTTCKELGGDKCNEGENEFCPGEYISVPDTGYCCNQTCEEQPLPICEILGGDICVGTEICPGEFLESSDDYCCNQNCEELLQTCAELGGECKTDSCTSYIDCSSLPGTCASGYCCDGACTQKTCAELGGTICTGEQTCSGAILDAPDTTRCCSGICEEPPIPQANLILLFSNTNYELKFNVNIDGIVYSKVYYYYYTRTFTESNGVGVILTQGQQCYLSTGCESKVSVNYRIEPNGILIYENKYFWTTYDSETFTLKYWGTDDNGYDVYVEQNMCVQKSQFTENC